MAQIAATEGDIESFREELAEFGRNFSYSLRRSVRSSLRIQEPSFGHVSLRATSYGSYGSSLSTRLDEESALQWAAIERLPTYQRVRTSLLDVNDGGKQMVDVTTLGAVERQFFIENLIKHIEHDNLRLLRKIKKRIDKVGIELPKVEVRYDNLHVEAECEVVNGKPLPTLWNSLKGLVLSLSGLSAILSQKYKIKIIEGASGVIKPGRMTLLLGPPGGGKTSLLKALSGNLDKSLEVNGEITYNGYRLDQFVPQKTSAYISQYDLHIPEMTVRETLAYSSRFQGVGSRADIMTELSRREKEAGILPDPDIDTYMKATSQEKKGTPLRTDYVLKILGLDVCADIIAGDAMRRGISGGQKRRLTTGEMIVGPTKALFMDEISNGLDSSTTYQIVACLQQLAHITDATIVVGLLQPAPETFDLFDDIILLAEGKVVYHGPRTDVLDFFESCGFKCPERKGVADFLQEVISKKDQPQYWYGSRETYRYQSVNMLAKKFKESVYAKNLTEQLTVPISKSKSRKDAISFEEYSMSKWSLFKTCLSREYLLMKRNSFVYIFKAVQLCIIASIAMTVFLRTKMDKIDLVHANYFMGAIFYALVVFLVDGFPELSLTVSKLDVFYKQRDFNFYPAWAYAIPAAILKVPLSFLPAVVWTSVTYFVIGYSPEAGRFFRQMLLLFCMHLSANSMFRFIASVMRTAIGSLSSGIFFLVLVMVFSGFVIPRPAMPSWLKWGFWASPMSYGEIGFSNNEFLAPRWQQIVQSTNMTIGHQTLDNRGLDFRGYYFWISIGALVGFTLLFNVGFTLALTFLRAPGSRPIISSEKAAELERIRKGSDDLEMTQAQSDNPARGTATETQPGKVTLPFEPLSLVFQDLVYHVDMPVAMKERGFTEDKLVLLRNLTGTFRPGILTALMGASGAGKTTLLDVLAGRKTSGTIEGDIRIGGYPKVSKTFARISGYCEQTDVHSPQITVEESVLFSAWLRLDPKIDSKTKSNFVNEVLETIELKGIKDSLVGIPGATGLSPEQRKRLTIAVELVANPSIIFLDEPTTGLDARSAAIVIRAVKNVAVTGRTIVCTIHQPSIDIFEAFDEVVLLKPGGRMIYCGPLGQHSHKIIEYFESIAGVPKIKNNYNPATWMVEVSSASSETELGVDFADLYLQSALYQSNKEQAKRLSSPPPGSKNLEFPTTYPQDAWGQFKACLWKQFWSYWRSPSYNLFRLGFMLASSLIYGILFWKKGTKLENQQSLFSVFGSMYSAVIFCGICNCASVLPYIATERRVYYREKFAGMYDSWAYSLAQVVIEIPYIFAQVVIFTCISYPMIGYYGSAYKVFWYMYAMFCSLLYFNYMGMMIIAITPSFPVAAVLQQSFYTMFNLFSGFMVPRPHVPNWWIWLYYITPSSWSLNAMLTSQYGDIHKEIKVFDNVRPVSEFLKSYFGFHHDLLPLVGVMLIFYPLLFAFVFAYCIKNLNFVKR